MVKGLELIFGRRVVRWRTLGGPVNTINPAGACPRWRSVLTFAPTETPYRLYATRSCHLTSCSDTSRGMLK